MLSTIVSQLKLPFARKKKPTNLHHTQLSGKNSIPSSVQRRGVEHVDFVSSSAFAHSCYDGDEDLALQAKSSDAAMACALLSDMKQSSPRAALSAPTAAKTMRRG